MTVHSIALAVGLMALGIVLAAGGMASAAEAAGVGLIATAEAMGSDTGGGLRAMVPIVPVKDRYSGSSTFARASRVGN
ncbi:MAG: hypothetical protein AB1646_13030 [Thermodesulfobacteriota bacterium]